MRRSSSHDSLVLIRVLNNAYFYDKIDRIFGRNLFCSLVSKNYLIRKAQGAILLFYSAMKFIRLTDVCDIMIFTDKVGLLLKTSVTVKADRNLI